MEKLKVALICQFSNPRIREKLPLSNRVLTNTLRHLLGYKQLLTYGDVAPWVTNLINEFEKFEDVELHVIAPHTGLKVFTYELEINGVYYHFLKPELPLQVDILTNVLLKRNQRKYRLNRFFVKQFLKRINPDIVNLIGTENPFYSITALDIKSKPVFVSAQTVYTNPDRKKHSGVCDQFRWDTELKIHKKEKYFGCGGRMHHDLILNNNSNAIIFKNFFPIQKPGNVKEVPKVYDFVFYAFEVSKQKGIEDAIEALSLAKQERHDVSLNVVGNLSPGYRNLLIDKIASLELSKNVTFNDFFTFQSDMHQHIKKSKFALLPIKLDIISGTVIEAMLLGLPVVTFKTSGTPYLNKDGETVLLADIGDIEKLSVNMLKLLNSPGLAEKMSTDAKAFVEKEFDNTVTATRLLNCYKAIVDHYHYNKPIPSELIFNTEEFPIYSNQVLK